MLRLTIPNINKRQRRVINSQKPSISLQQSYLRVLFFGKVLLSFEMLPNTPSKYHSRKVSISHSCPKSLLPCNGILQSSKKKLSNGSLLSQTIMKSSSHSRILSLKNLLCFSHHALCSPPAAFPLCNSFPLLCFPSLLLLFKNISRLAAPRKFKPLSFFPLATKPKAPPLS